MAAAAATGSCSAHHNGPLITRLQVHRDASQSAPVLSQHAEPSTFQIKWRRGRRRCATAVRCVCCCGRCTFHAVNRRSPSFTVSGGRAGSHLHAGDCEATYCNLLPAAVPHNAASVRASSSSTHGLRPGRQAARRAGLQHAACGPSLAALSLGPCRVQIASARIGGAPGSVEVGLWALRLAAEWQRACPERANLIEAPLTVLEACDHA